MTHRPRGHESAPIEAQYGKLLGAHEAAAYLGMHVRRLRRLLKSGQLPALRQTNGRFIGVYEAHLEEWLRAHLAQPPNGRSTGRRETVDSRIAHLMPKKLYFPV